MKTSRLTAVVAALAVLAAACGGGSDNSAPATSTTSAPATTLATTTAPPTTAAIPEGGSSIQGLHIDNVTFGADGFVEISNTSGADISLDGLWLCKFPNYVPLSGTIAAGDVIHVSAADLGGLAPDGGEAALYSERAFDSPSAIFDYVGWGTGGKRGEVASLAGIWPQGVNVTAPPDFIELGGAPGDPEAWG